MQNSNPYPIEKIISALSYLTMGGVGFVWFLIAIVSKKVVRPFLMYHILLSIFFSMAYFLFYELAKLIYIILVRVPIVNKLLYLVMIYPMPIFPNLSLIQTLAFAVTLYLAVTSFMGYYSYLPWFSDIIKGNFRK